MNFLMYILKGLLVGTYGVLCIALGAYLQNSMKDTVGITKYQVTCELAEGKREINFTDVVEVYPLPRSTNVMAFKLGNGIVVSMHGYKCMVLKYTAITEE